MTLLDHFGPLHLSPVPHRLLIYSLDGGNSASGIGFLFGTNFFFGGGGGSKTLYLKEKIIKKQSLSKIASTKERLLKHDLHFHGTSFDFLWLCNDPPIKTAVPRHTPNLKGSCSPKGVLSTFRNTPPPICVKWVPFVLLAFFSPVL